MKLSDEALNRLQLEFGGPGKADQLEAARLELRRRCKDSLWFFAYHALEMKDIDTVLHHDMAERFQRRSNRRYTLWLVPRGHLKTSLWTESGTLWSLINNPHRRHLIVNAKLDNAEGILHDIRQFVTTREVFRWLFPEYCIDLAPRHKQKQCRDLLDRLDMPCSNWAGRREGTIQIMSVEASLVSKHFDEMWYDDPVNDINSSTKEYRDKIQAWFRNSLQLRDSPMTTLVRVIGTRWNFDDLYSRIIKQEMARREAQMQAGKKVRPRWLFYIRSAEERDGAGKLRSIWPERYSHASLMAIKEEVGSYIYSCQYENNPLPEENAIFKYNDIHLINKFEVPEDVTSFAAIDMADEETTKGDYTVITVASFDSQNRMYVREIQRGRFMPKEIVERVVRMVKLWDLKKVAIETTGFQKTIYRFAKQHSAEMGVNVPWVEMQRGKTSKRKRILALQPRVERGDFYVVQGIKNIDWLIDEMSTYDQGAHDDILDTLADLEAVYYSSPKLEAVVPVFGTYDQVYGKLNEDDDITTPSPGWITSEEYT